MSASAYTYAYTRLGGTSTNSNPTRTRRLRLAALGTFIVFVLASVTLLHSPDDEESPLARDIVWDDHFKQQLYIAIAPNTTRLPRAKRHYPTDECLEASLARGEHCDQVGYGLSDKPTIDLVWSWVNSSDPVWRRANAQMTARRKGKELSHAELQDVDESTEGFRFDEYDELRHSMRSAVKAFGAEVRRLNLVVADFPVPPEYPLDVPVAKRDAWRLGQVPSWLAYPGSQQPGNDSDWVWVPDAEDGNVASPHWTSEKDGTGIEFAVHHHSTYFSPYIGSNFCSFCIESHIPDLRGVADVFIYTNDDMYFLKDHVVSDYWSAPWGLVMRPQSIPVPADPDPTPIPGEWQALRHTNHMISRRFGPMERTYMTHQPKSGSVTLWREFSTMFSVEFQRTQLRQFREIYFEDPADAANPDRLADLPWPFNLDPEVNTEGRGVGSPDKADVHTTFGLGHFVMERHREALLWSWVVGRMGDPDGHFDVDQAWGALGARNEAETIVVHDWEYGRPNESRDSRRGGSLDEALNAAGFASRKTANYAFVSADGHRFYNWRQEWKDEDSRILDTKAGEICIIRRTECFPQGGSANDIFRTVAFDRARCGDCIIQALIRESGPRGFGAFLPSPNRALHVAPAKLAQTLPLASDWRGVDFSLRGALEGGVPNSLRDDDEQAPSSDEPDVLVNVRRWILRVLDRYRYSHAVPNGRFVIMRDVNEAQWAVNEVDKETSATACINDNIMRPHDMYKDEGITEGQKVQQILHEWQTRRWPEAPAWEIQ